MKTNPLNYDEQMQRAAQAAFADSTGSDFWTEVQQLQDAHAQEEPTEPQEPLVKKRVTT